MIDPTKADRIYSRKWLEAERQLAIRGFVGFAPLSPSSSLPILPSEPIEPIEPNTNIKIEDPYTRLPTRGVVEIPGIEPGR